MYLERLWQWADNSGMTAAENEFDFPAGECFGDK